MTDAPLYRVHSHKTVTYPNGTYETFYFMSAPMSLNDANNVSQNILLDNSVICDGVKLDTPEDYE